jgi:hypothetical protein
LLFILIPRKFGKFGKFTVHHPTSPHCRKAFAASVTTTEPLSHCDGRGVGVRVS